VTFKYNHLPHFLSLGAGVQSSTLALMYATGELTPMPEAAIFADTQAEPQSVYDWLDWLDTQLPYPVHRVTAGDLGAEALQIRTSKKGAVYTKTAIPFWTLSADGRRGSVGHRTCTADFKIAPIRKKQRELAHIKRGETQPQCVAVIGISVDESRRMKPSRDKWCVARWPLIEKRFRRHQCLDWMESKGYALPPRSACRFCPYHSNAEWRRLEIEEPSEFLAAVDFEKQIQRAKEKTDNCDATPFLHSSCKPLDSIDFRTDVERGQQTFWDDECEGMCGV